MLSGLFNVYKRASVSTQGVELLGVNRRRWQLSQLLYICGRHYASGSLGQVVQTGV